MKGLTLTKKEERRANVLAALEGKRWMMGEACTLLELSERQVWRLLGRYRAQGLAGLVHGNRGRKPAHAAPTEVKESVVGLARGVYDGANYTHMAELLAEREGVGSLPVDRPADPEGGRHWQPEAAKAIEASRQEGALSPGGDAPAAGRQPARLAARPGTPADPRRRHR